MFAEPLSSLDVHKLVFDYLNHYAYLGTLETFVQESGMKKLEDSSGTFKMNGEPSLLKKHEREYSKYSPIFVARKHR